MTVIDKIDKYLGEGAGSKQRDYIKTHKSTLKNLKKAGVLKAWNCPSCGRQNSPKEDPCIRCGKNKGKTPLYTLK
jgi:uncharacterized OB-fold protein